MDDATNLFYFSGKYLDKDGNVTVDTLCRATSGFEQRSGEMPWKGWPLRGRVMVVASKQPVDKVQATHIDDLLIMCR